MSDTCLSTNQSLLDAAHVDYDDDDDDDEDRAYVCQLWDNIYSE